MQALVLDAYTGKHYAYTGDVLGVVSSALMASGIQPRTDGQLTTSQAKRARDAFRAFRRRSDSLWIKRQADVQEGLRRDAGLAGAAAGFPRDFEHIYAEVLEEKRRPLNYTALMQMDRRVPLGAKTHTVRRKLGQGEAQVWRGGSRFPVVGGSKVEESFPVIYIVAGVETNHFEMLSDSFAGRNQFADDTRMAVRAIDEKVNNIAFNGDVPSNMYGFLTYPSLAKSLSTETFTAAGMTSPDAIVQELHRVANFAREQSGGTFRPNRLVTSIRIRNFLFTTQYSTASDITIGQFFLQGQSQIDGITRIDDAHELEGIGPNGEDGIMAYDDSLESTAFVMVQPPTALPVHSISSIQNQVLYFAAIGGTVMRDVGNNNLMLAPGA